MSEDEVKVSESLVYHNSSQLDPIYKLSKVLQQTGGSLHTTSITSQTESIFDLPAANVMSLYNSNLSFVTYDPGLAGKAIWEHRIGCPTVSRFVVQTRSGQVLIDVQNASQYMRMVTPFVNTVNDLANMPNANNRAGLGAAIEPSRYASNSAVARSVAPAGFTKFADYIDNARVAIEGPVDYLGMEYATVATVAAGTYSRFELPLSMLQGSLFSEDVNLYTGQILQLHVYWEAGNKVKFHADSVVTPASGTDTDIATATEITELQLNLAIDTNELSSSAVKQKMLTTGLHMTIPYTHNRTINTGASTATSLNYKLNRSHGKTLNRVMIGCFNTGGTNSASLNIDNSSTAKITSLYTEVNNTRLQDGEITLSTSDDVRYLRPYLSGSAGFQSVYEFRINQVWCDVFNNQKSLDWADTDSTVSGLSLENELIYNANFSTVNAAYIWQLFFVCTKELSITANGITVT
jgi:hypothetical protein